MKILIAGGRDFADKQFLEQYMSKYLEDATLVISGTAKGADSLGEKWANSNDIPVERYPAQWSKYGAAAGPIRNQEMLDKGKPDLVVVFKGGTGSAHMAKIARKAGVKVMRPKPREVLGEYLATNFRDNRWHSVYNEDQQEYWFKKADELILKLRKWNIL